MQARLEQFIQGLTVVDVLPRDGPGAVIAGRIHADLESSGQPIGRADPMIAAIAISHGLILATGNKNHYKRVQALGYPLRLDNWRE